MAVTLDAPTDQGPMWKVGSDGCVDRLYLYGEEADHAVDRAVTEHGWTETPQGVLCRPCYRDREM